MPPNDVFSGVETIVRIAVTGATGFIGSALMQKWKDQEDLHAIIRRPDERFPTASVVGDIGPDTEWGMALKGVDTVVHCAGRAHILKEDSASPLEVFRRVNCAGTLGLARAAANAGVRRLVFVSSVGVMGHRMSEVPLRGDEPPLPTEHYAISKYEAEQGLMEISAETGLEVAIVRPPMVYGPDAPANFQRLIRLVKSGLPLPLGRFRSRRSFVGMSNLADVLLACVVIPEAAGAQLMVSDGEDLSVADLVRRIARIIDKPLILLPVPQSAMRLAGRLVGRSADIDRLMSPLRVDIDNTKRILSWQPRYSVDDELKMCLL